MKWMKVREPWRAEVIRDVNFLDSDGKILASADKDNPVSGIVTHYGNKKIGRNSVRMYSFHPDFMPDKCWDCSSKWLRRINNQ